MARAEKTLTRLVLLEKSIIFRLVRHRSVSAQARQEARVLDVSIVGSVAETLPRRQEIMPGSPPTRVDQVGTNAQPRQNRTYSASTAAP